MKRGRRSFTPTFKADAVSLVQQQGYTVGQACQALSIGEAALRRWVAQVEAETAGLTHPEARPSPPSTNAFKRWKRR